MVISSTSQQEKAIATKSIQELVKTAALISKRKNGTVKIKIQESGDVVTIPRKALDLLFNILSTMAKGKSITLLPSDAEISTQEAAHMLNVSRPQVVKLLEEGKIPYKKIRSHGRILLEDLIAYHKRMKAAQRKGITALIRQAQELRLGYE